MSQEEGRVFKSKRNPAVLAVWVALLAASKLLPTIPIIGTGATFSISTILTPLAGILFGPLTGIIVAAAGGFLGQLLAPHTAWMGIFTFLNGVFNAGCAGFVLYKKTYIPLGIILLGSLLWYLHPIGRESMIYPAVYYGLGVAAILFSHFFGRKWIGRESRIKRFIAIFTAAYTGFVAASAYANYVGGLLIMEWPATMWKGLTLVSPTERALFSMGVAIVGVPLLYGLPKIGLMVGPDLQSGKEEKKSP
jgi:uncharacterized membrane protein